MPGITRRTFLRRAAVAVPAAAVEALARGGSGTGRQESLRLVQMPGFVSFEEALSGVVSGEVGDERNLEDVVTAVRGGFLEEGGLSLMDVLLAIDMHEQRRSNPDFSLPGFFKKANEAKKSAWRMARAAFERMTAEAPEGDDFQRMLVLEGVFFGGVPGERGFSIPPPRWEYSDNPRALEFWKTRYAVCQDLSCGIKSVNNFLPKEMRVPFTVQILPNHALPTSFTGGDVAFFLETTTNKDRLMRGEKLPEHLQKLHLDGLPPSYLKPQSFSEVSVEFSNCAAELMAKKDASVDDIQAAVKYLEYARSLTPIPFYTMVLGDAHFRLAKVAESPAFRAKSLATAESLMRESARHDTMAFGPCVSLGRLYAFRAEIAETQTDKLTNLDESAQQYEHMITCRIGIQGSRPVFDEDELNKYLIYDVRLKHAVKSYETLITAAQESKSLEFLDRGFEGLVRSYRASEPVLDESFNTVNRVNIGDAYVRWHQRRTGDDVWVGAGKEGVDNETLLANAVEAYSQAITSYKNQEYHCPGTLGSYHNKRANTLLLSGKPGEARKEISEIIRLLGYTDVRSVDEAITREQERLSEVYPIETLTTAEGFRKHKDSEDRVKMLTEIRDNPETAKMFNELVAKPPSG